MLSIGVGWTLSIGEKESSVRAARVSMLPGAAGRSGQPLQLAAGPPLSAGPLALWSQQWGDVILAAEFKLGSLSESP